eukprot:14092105-Alexandrium_andersonii.AAC.1
MATGAIVEACCGNRSHCLQEGHARPVPRLPRDWLLLAPMERVREGRLLVLQAALGALSLSLIHISEPTRLALI